MASLAGTVVAVFAHRLVQGVGCAPLRRGLYARPPTNHRSPCTSGSGQALHPMQDKGLVQAALVVVDERAGSLDKRKWSVVCMLR